jgi:chloramphenicol-sensitive protein RarD
MKQLSAWKEGAISAVLAYILWGFLPFYWRSLALLDPLHILAVRIILSFIFVMTIFFVQKNTGWLCRFFNKSTLPRVIGAGMIFTVNSGIYIWAVNWGHTVEASMGYFINPLVSIVFGMIFFHEKMKGLQWTAFFLVLSGVGLLTIFSGKLPIISLSLAVTFGFYGLLKKNISLPVLEGLAAEGLVTLPIAVVLLFIPETGLAYLVKLPGLLYIPLLLIGITTTFPMYLFTKGARALPLSALGFIQFISPTMQFCIGFLVFHEPVPLRNLIAFAFIWAGALVYPLSYMKLSNPAAFDN